MVLTLLSDRATTRYLDELKALSDLLNKEVQNPVSVAILDTGVDLPDGVPLALKKGRYESYSWIDVPDDTETERHPPRLSTGDPDGHGTHMTSIFLGIARTCKLYVVQVAGARSKIIGEEASDAIAASIARVGCQSSKNLIMQLTQHQAINYAANVWHVDIVSMSCGFLKSNPRVKHEIHQASAKVLFLAAAGNSGATGVLRWPASDNNVLCINATDGNGDKFGGNPTPDRSGANFSFLGCAVPGYLRAIESEKVTKVARSGTSHATAVAAAVAAISMQIFQDCEGDFNSPDDKVAYQKTKEALRTKRGMQKIFYEMTNMQLGRDGYDFVQPWAIVPATGGKHAKALQIAQLIITRCKEVW
jgi:subtilisin family serine protease